MERRPENPARFEVTVGRWRVVTVDGMPVMYDQYRKHARLCDELELEEPNLCCIAVGRSDEEWPLLVVAQSYSPAGNGFDPGVLLAPDTEHLFVGAGERILVYDLAKPERVHEDATDVGFWGWRRHGDVVVMSAELELAAWSTSGNKLWSTFVEPPWSYRVDGESVVLDVMGNVRRFSLWVGPQSAS